MAILFIAVIIAILLIVVIIAILLIVGNPPTLTRAPDNQFRTMQY